MEANISSSVKECLGLENNIVDGAAVKLTKSQKKNRRKRLKKLMKANLEPVDKPQDTEDLTTTTSDHKMTVSSPAATGNGRSLISGMKNDNGNGAAKLSKSKRKKMRKMLEKQSNVSLECATTNRNVNGTEEKEKKPQLKGKPTLGQILNPQYLDNLEADTSGVGSGTIVTDNPASKKRKRQKNKNKNSASSDVVKVCENTQEKVVANKGLGTTTVLEAITVEMVSGKSAIPDEMGLIATTNPNVNRTGKKKKKLKPKNNRPDLGEILNPQDLQDLEAANGETGLGKTATDTTVSKKRKRHKLKEKDLASGGSLCTGESPQDTIIMNEGLSGTTTVVESTTLSRETSREREKKKPVGLNTIENTDVKEITHVATSGKKLLIFDVNGLLADIVYAPPKNIKADTHISRRAIFKRPFLDDFLSFCFERFNVGIWSSRTKKNLDPVVDFLLGDWRKKLLFRWDASQCTNSGIGTLEDKHKCIVFKDLRKIWDTNGPGNSWIKGTFHESNTLLLDDSPYKALLNTKHTGIFPASYSYTNKDDDFLGPKGKLQTYLEGLAAADDVKTYVEQLPFGQGAIDEKSQNWAFYSRVLKGQNR